MNKLISWIIGIAGFLIGGSIMNGHYDNGLEYLGRFIFGGIIAFGSILTAIYLSGINSKK